MSLDRTSRAREVVETVRSRSPAERDALLDSACDGHRAEARGRAAAGRRPPADDELQQPPPGPAVAAPSADDRLSSRLAPRGDEPTTFAPGDVVAGRFRIVRFIARGGMGEVYEAEDLELRGRVALKTSARDVAHDPRGLERFKREIQLARKVTHPNVCRIFDLGSTSTDAAGRDTVPS